MADSLLQSIRRHADRHANAEGFAPTPVPGLTAMQAGSPTPMVKTLYKPLICLVLQGAKQVTTGTTTMDFAAGQSLIVSVDLPLLSRITQASRQAPYLALALELDMAVIRDIMATLQTPPADPPAPEPPFFVEDTDAAIADCALRLMRLLDRPDAIAVLHPAILREIHYWMLEGRHGAALRNMARQDSHAERVARAVAVLRREVARPVAVEELAAVAGMSASSFHHHFKAVTSLSPLQFHKHLRLMEARRMMHDEAASAAHAAFSVGYESVSQFSREYARLFGAPPRRDVAGRDGKGARASLSEEREAKRLLSV